jgi:hypothetical protein
MKDKTQKQPQNVKAEKNTVKELSDAALESVVGAFNVKKSDSRTLPE